ncbi:MAG: YidC/Oxa1 family membrane protein insertase [Patescibacteria group bacterium]
MTYIFNEFFYRPLFNVLIFLYNNFSFGDLGIAIVVLTILIRIILLPLFYKSAKDQAIMQRLMPRIKEIQKNHKDDKEKQSKAIMEIYREHKVNPFSGFFMLLVQLPILIALYQVFLKEITVESLNNGLYSFIFNPEIINHQFLGLVDLSQRNLIIVVLASLAQYFQGKLSLLKKDKSAKDLSPAEAMGRQMVFIAPVLTFVFLYSFGLPSAVGLYWLTTSIFSVIQQIVINKRLSATHEVEKEIKEHEPASR